MADMMSFGVGEGEDQMFKGGIRTEASIVCYPPALLPINGVWQGESPLTYSVPLFLFQLTLIVLTTRLMVFILKPLRQPRIIAEVIAGVLLGPSLMGAHNGKLYSFWLKVFPEKSLTVLETAAFVGIIYHSFMVGLEVDLTAMNRIERKAMFISLASIILPLIVATFASFLFGNITTTITNNMKHPILSQIFFLGSVVSTTACPVLARLLAELKILNTDLGRTAMSSSMIIDAFAWPLAFLVMSLSDYKAKSLAPLWVILANTGFVAFCMFVIRPAVAWMIRRSPEGENLKQSYICLILIGVMGCSLVTDFIGSHAVYGAFLYGIVIPNRPVGTALIEKLDDFGSGLMLPLFFTITGMRTNIGILFTNRHTTWHPLSYVLLMAYAVKLAGTVLIAALHKMPYHEGFTLGMVLNTKGLLKFIILNIGIDQKVVDQQSMAIFVIAAVLITGIIGPIASVIFRPARHFKQYKRRMIYKSKADAELRILACIHTPRNVPTIINLLVASLPTNDSPICVYALHLLELTGRAANKLIVHEPGKSRFPAVKNTQAPADQITNAFQIYKKNRDNVSVTTLTTISPFSTMHEDICNLAQDKHIAFIILPFHKQQTVDGTMEATNPAFRSINQNVLANAPCSVGILVDRGFGGSTWASSSNRVSHHTVTLFFGGPDDREALSYAWRMAKHAVVSLTVVRFIPGDDAMEQIQRSHSISEERRILTVTTDNERENQFDEEYIKEFKMKMVNDESIVYVEKVVNNGEETIAAIRSTENNPDLYIVGRGQSNISPLMVGLNDWSECPELGTIGDMLASSDSAVVASVLVVQQYLGAGLDGMGTPDSQQSDHSNNIHDFNHGSHKDTTQPVHQRRNKNGFGKGW